MWDEKKIGANELVGRVNVSLVALSSQQSYQKWMTLQRRTDKGIETTKGELLLNLQYKYLNVWDQLYAAARAVTEKPQPQAIRYI